MKKILNWRSPEVVNTFDEVTLWSAPFGRLLLENIPMATQATVLDIGFGTGFPLIELSQRFGEQSRIYGIDIWPEGVSRTREKIKVLGLSNIEIIEKSATQIDIVDEQIDLVTSNLGVNNFDQKEEVYQEIHRVLKPNGQLAITTNPIGTFEELFDIFHALFLEMKWEAAQAKLAAYVAHRNTDQGIIAEIEKHGFILAQRKADVTNLRFVDAEAVLNHSLMRIGFRAYWEQMITDERDPAQFFERLVEKIKHVISSQGEFRMRIPMLYLAFEKG